MILSKENIGLILTDPEDMRLKNLLTDYADLQNLSETRLYQKKMPRSQVFLILRDNQPIGEISLKTIRWYNRKAELQIALKKDARGKGIGGQALKMLIVYAFNALNFHRLEAEALDFNEAGKALIKKMGFRKEGVLREAKYFNGRYFDIIRYGLLKKEFIAAKAKLHK